MSFVQIKTEPIGANDRNLNETNTQTTSSSGEMGEEFENKMQIDHTKRFDFLLKQSEIFTHFISNSTKSTSKGKPKPGFSRHHRKTEREQDGAPSAMKIEDKDYSQKQNLTTMNNRIVPPNGKRKTSSIPEPKAAKISRPTKHLIAQDFQFFPLRLFELLDQEIYYFRKTVANKKFGSGTVKIEDEEAKPLSKEELSEKEALLSLGFTNWTRNDFDLFIKAIVKYGRDNIENIAKAVDGKLPEEVRKYNEVFWERCHELQDIERIMEQIQEGEAKIQSLSADQKKMSNQVQKLNFVPTKRHIREVLLFFFNLNKSAAEAERLLCDAYGECVPTSSTCERWFVRFRNGDFDIEDRPSQPKKVKDNESLLQEDCDPTQKNAAKTLETAKAAKTKLFKAAKRKRKSKLEN